MSAFASKLGDEVTALLTNSAVTTAAQKLASADKNKVACEPVRGALEPLGVAGAYAVQSLLTERAEKAGRRLVGRKIGLTSKAVQAQLGVDQPDFGILFDDMAFGDDEEVPLARLIQPKIEAEIAFVIGKELPHARPTFTDVLSAVEYALPAIEIVDSRVKDWDISIYDTIADNASSGLFVVGGSPKKIDNLDLRLCGMSFEHRGEPISVGCGAACLGHPINAVAWLAGQMAQIGRPLGEGDLVLSGALGPMVGVAPGDAYEVRISGLGRVGANFSKD